MVIRSRFFVAVALLFHSLGASTIQPASGQDVPPPNRGGFTTSMGIPSTVRWSMGASMGVHRRDGNEAAFYLTGGMYRDLLNPAIAAFGLSIEAYGGRRGQFDDFSEGWDGGGRIGISSPVARFSLGADFNLKDQETDFFLSIIHPLRRGGFLVDGGSLRIDYLPGRNHTTAFGFTMPVGQRFAGKTRPRADFAVLSRPRIPPRSYTPTAAISSLLDSTRGMSHWITRLTVPFVAHYDGDWEVGEASFVAEMEEIRAHLDSGVGPGASGIFTPEAEVRGYHREMERAFSMAVSDRDLPFGTSTALGIRVWDKARAIILEHVLLPYNALLGRKKKNDSTQGFSARASAAFFEWLSTETPVEKDRLRAVIWAFSEVLVTVEDVRAVSEEKWGDSRFVFLPYQLVLKPEEHDSQAELDALVERAVREEFQDGNQVFYVENEQFQVEFARMVAEAEDYSVLWIHDVRGLDGTGQPDEVAYRQVVNVYLPALIDAVKKYDRTGKIPQHFILLDQWFFQANKGRLWLDLLEDPLNHQIDLPGEYRNWARNIADIQSELRSAVANSELLQAQSLYFPLGWIENLVKVHVNITNPADVTFWTDELLPLIGLPDMIARDHRKIAFFDVSEDDPYKGRAMYTGMGIGEHYVGAGWEDRALMVRGPGILGLKYAARQLLLNQGFSEEEIPFELKPRPLAEDYQSAIEREVTAGRARARALGVHNQTGYDPKYVNVLKATLYTLMPSGSVIKAPDSLWNNPLWGSMMLGNALRGGRSLIIAPAIAHAPSDGFPQMSRAQELLGRLVIAGALFEEYLDRSGGMMKVGLYNFSADAGNVPAKLHALLATLEDTPWLRELYGFSPSTLQALGGLADDLEAEGFSRRYFIDQEPVAPKLHLKAHMYVTPEAWDGLMGGPEMGTFLTTFYGELARQNLNLAEGRIEEADMEAFTNALIPAGEDLVEAHLSELSAREEKRGALFFMVGSHNQNHRSFIMDGEVAFVVSSWAALHGLPDFIVLAGLSVWVESLEELEELFPRYEGIQRRLSRWIRIVV